MIQVTDRNGNKGWVTYEHGGKDNPDGFHCTTFSDDSWMNEVESFDIRPTDIYDYYDLSYPRVIAEVTKYIQDRYKEKVIE